MALTTAELTSDEVAVESALALGDGIALFNADRQLENANDAFLEMVPSVRVAVRTGISVETLYRAMADGLFSEDDSSRVDDWVADRVAGNRALPTSYKVDFGPFGVFRIVERQRENGGFLLIHRDITREQRGIEAAARADALLSGTLEHLEQGVAAFDNLMRLLAWNSRYFELCNLPHTFARSGTPLRDIMRFLARRGDFGEGDAESLADASYSQVLANKGASYERLIDSCRIIEVTVQPFENGGIVCTFSDITGRREAEIALRESEERYALAAAGSKDGLWDWNLTENRIFYSDRWKELLGHVPEEISDGPDEWFSRIHPEDVDRVTAQIDAHLSGAITNFESEHRVRHYDERYRWILSRGLAVRDESGQAYRIAGSITDVTERKRSEEQAIHDALHDTLTNLPNRTLFLERVRQSLSRLKRAPDAHFAVVYLDLDRFKVVNESLGHVHGDDLIIAAAQRLEQSMKFGDTVARLGGDEYAILLEEIETKERAEDQCRLLQAVLSPPFQLGGKEVYTTASMGISHSSDSYAKPEDVLRDSELAMYRAKELGKARAVAFNDNMRMQTTTPLEVETDLRRALERDEMRLQYQPIIDLASGRLTGFEALVRWNHSERGLIPPGDFIPLAEETGLIVELGEWVLNRASTQIVEWSRHFKDRDPLTIAVNLSGRQFSQYDLVGIVTKSLERTGLAPEQLKLEITESILMDNARRAAQMLAHMKDLNIKVCIDDFGTGYSSLSYLHTFPIDTLKIDKSFVKDMGNNRQNLEIVRTIILLAQNLRMDVIAEGVESPEHLAQLRALGCGFAQGFLLSRPITPEAAFELLKEDKTW